MNSITENNTEKNKYLMPSIEILKFEAYKEILCLSKEEDNDNEFDAGGLF